MRTAIQKTSTFVRIGNRPLNLEAGIVNGFWGRQKQRGHEAFAAIEYNRAPLSDSCLGYLELLNMRMLIRGAQTVFPGEMRQANVLVEDGKILDPDASPQAAADEVVEANGLYLLPGLVDDQVHFREPGLTHKEDLAHASRACAKGGVTTFLEMPNTNPTTTTVERLHEKLAIAADSSIVNYGFYIGATTDNVAELAKAERTPGIKIFIGSSTGNMLVDEQAALEAIFAETTLPITAHCEDESTVRANEKRYEGSTDLSDHSRIRDKEAAYIATSRAVELAKRHNHRFHVLHLSTGDELELLAEPDGLITAEVCPHHLFFHIGDYERLGSRIKVNPSIKSADDNRRLWDGLVEGRIQVIATDHAPHTLEEKAIPYPGCPSGMPAVENSLALILSQVHQGRCSLVQVVDWMCDAPARVWDIVGKGRIESGYDADLVLVDLELEETIHDEQQQSKCKWSPWSGVSLTGWPVRTWVNGQEVFRRTEEGLWFTDSPLGSEATYDHQRGGYWA